MSSDYLKVTFLDGLNINETKRLNYRNRVTPFANSEIYFAPIESAEKLTEGDDEVKTVYKLSLNLKNINYDFSPGDTIGILPQNNQVQVEKILIRLNTESIADKPCKLEILPDTTKKNPSIPKHLPLTSTIRNIFLNHVDLFTPPKKIFLKSLIRFVEDPEERTKLENICAPKASKEYTELITGPGGNLLGLLNSFPSCQPPVEIILEHLPPLLPRPYSISSSPLIKTQLDITFFVLEHNDKRKGVCTGWLEYLIENKINSSVPFYFRQANNFRFPEEKVPLILVATGTGIAPFRSFLQHISMDNERIVPVWLFYGCRYSNKDYLYKEEIDDYLQNKILTKLDVTFSREGPEKQYVQHNIGRQGSEFIEWLLKKDATLFICGDFKKVVKDVKGAVVNNLTKYGGMSSSDAEYFVREMESRKKLIVDMWV